MDLFVGYNQNHPGCLPRVEISWWNVCVINRTRKSLNCSLFQAAFYIFTRNILGTQCGVSCVKSDGVVVVVQIYSIDKDANESLPLDLAVSRKIPEVLQKSKNMRQLKSRLFSLLFSQLLLKLCLFSFTLFKSFRDSINRTSFFKCDPQIFNDKIFFEGLGYDFVRQTRRTRKADAIWIQTNAMCHSQYYKVVDEAKKNNIPIRYFSFASPNKCAEQFVQEDKKASK